MTTEQRKKLDDLKARLQTLQNAGSRAHGYIVRAEESGGDEAVHGYIKAAERELASILKRKRVVK